MRSASLRQTSVELWSFGRGDVQSRFHELSSDGHPDDLVSNQLMGARARGIASGKFPNLQVDRSGLCGSWYVMCQEEWTDAGLRHNGLALDCE